jgi:hypothetical protein
VPGEWCNVRLIQSDLNPDWSHPHPCELDIMPLSGDPTPGNRQIFAADFATVRRERRADFDRYVAPMLRELGQYSLLAPDAGVAWQVLGDLQPPDPLAAAKVREQLPGLNDPSFHARLLHRKELESLGPAAALAIRRLDRTKLSAEQSAQLDQLLRPYRQVSDENARKMLTDPSFLLSCLYSTDDAIRKLAIGQLKSVTRKEMDFDPVAEIAQRESAIAAIREKLTAAKLIAAP